MIIIEVFSIKFKEFLENDPVVKTHDFSNNYTCLLPKKAVTGLESETMHSIPSSCANKG